MWVSEARAGAGEVSELGAGWAGLAAGEAGAHVTKEYWVMSSHVITSCHHMLVETLPGAVRGVAETVELAPV